MRPGDELFGEVAPLRRQPCRVGGHADGLDRGQVGGRALAGLHLADQELAQVEAQRPAAPEAEVDEHELAVWCARADEQVAGAGIAVQRAQRDGVELVEVAGHGGRRGPQVVAQPVAEGQRQQRVLPEAVVVQRGHDLPGESPIRVAPWNVADRPDRVERRDRRARGESPEQPCGGGEPFGVPRDRPGVDRVQPEHGRQAVEVADVPGGRHRQPGGQPVAEVGRVDLRLATPGDHRERLRPHLFGDLLEDRRPLPGLHDLDEEPEVGTLSARGSGGAADPVAAGRRQRLEVVVSHHGRTGLHSDVVLAELGRDHGRELGVVDVCVLEQRAVGHRTPRDGDR